MKKVDNFDTSKWLVENKITTQSRLNEKSTNKTIPYTYDGKTYVIFLSPGEYPLIVSGFYGGGEYRSFKNQPVSTLTVKGDGLKLPLQAGNLPIEGTPIINTELPDGYSSYVDAFRKKVKQGRISNNTGLHIDLRGSNFTEVDNFDASKELTENKITTQSRLNEEESNDLDFIVQKLKSKYDVSIKDDSVFLKTYYKNGSLKNWYTIKKVDDNMYRFSKGGRQLRDWSLNDLFSTLLDNPNLSL